VDLSVAVVAWNTARLLAECLASLRVAPAGRDVEIIVVDNASTDDSVEVVRRQFPGARLICNATNGGFARACNQAIAASRGRYVMLLNSDTLVSPAAIDGLITFMDRHPALGVCGPRLTRPDGRTQAFGFGRDPTLPYLLRRGLSRLLLDRALHDWQTPDVQEVDWVSGACLVARRQAIEQVGGLDEAMFLYFEDNDWCLRMRQAGWKVAYNPRVCVTHIGAQSAMQNPDAPGAYYRSLERFYAKHYGTLARLVLRCCLAPYRRMARR
jgi:GT2 family glycosyltransferase